MLPNNYMEALKRFEEAVADYAFKGAAAPVAQGYIEHEYEEAKQALMLLIEQGLVK